MLPSRRGFYPKSPPFKKNYHLSMTEMRVCRLIETVFGHEACGSYDEKTGDGEAVWFPQRGNWGWKRIVKAGHWAGPAFRIRGDAVA